MLSRHLAALLVLAATAPGCGALQGVLWAADAAIYDSSYERRVPAGETTRTLALATSTTPGGDPRLRCTETSHHPDVAVTEHILGLGEAGRVALTVTAGLQAVFGGAIMAGVHVNDDPDKWDWTAVATATVIDAIVGGVLAWLFPSRQERREYVVAAHTTTAQRCPEQARLVVAGEPYRVDSAGFLLPDERLRLKAHLRPPPPLPSRSPAAVAPPRLRVETPRVCVRADVRLPFSLEGAAEVCAR